MAIVGMKRVLPCALALGLVLPGVASAAIDLEIVSPTKQPHLTWVQDTPVGPYDIFRDPTCSPTTPLVVGQAGAVFDDSPSLPDGTYCYRVDDPGTLEASDEVSVTVDNTAPSVGPLSAPTGGVRRGSITLQTPASDATAGVDSVVFEGSKNGGAFGPIGGAVTGSSTFSSTWPTSSADDGTWVIHGDRHRSRNQYNDERYRHDHCRQHGPHRRAARRSS